MKFNPNSDRDYVNKMDLTDERLFTRFIQSIELKPFRHIPELMIHFNHPISVISGTNRSGKSTILMALACSHTDFQKRNPKNGKLERQTWGSMMKFTSQDNQKENWTYYIHYKIGRKIDVKRGQRKKDTRKWNGVAKKESQIKDRQAVFIDLDRIVPARFFSDKILNLANSGLLNDISSTNVEQIQSYLSFILEEEFQLKKIAEYLDKDIFKYDNEHHYTSYNAASGEDVLTKLIIDIVEATPNSLILIDEIELGLHPKVQTRLIDVLFNVAKKDSKQFIITSHSPTILNSLPKESRIFIEKKHDSNFKAIQNISVNAALTKMDFNSYPLIDLYCEDRESEKIIRKVIQIIEDEKELNNYSKLINIIASGSAEITYENYKSHQRTYDLKKIRCGYACILDGDMRNLKDKKGALSYPSEEYLHFLYSNEAPEFFLIRAYLTIKPNSTIKYHLNNSNPHCLFDKVVENSHFSDVNDVFNACWDAFIGTDNGNIYISSLKEFLLKITMRFSDDL